MKVMVRTIPHHRQHVYLATAERKIVKADISICKIWQQGDIGDLIQDGERVRFKPEAEEVELISFKPFQKREQTDGDHLPHVGGSEQEGSQEHEGNPSSDGEGS